MKTNFVLVDYENVQPKDLGLLKDGPFKVKVFLGPKQAKVSVSLASALQPLGGDAEYVILNSAGNNALDFYIAYYIGVLSCQEPSAYFHIISKDTGFDPLIEHLKGKKIMVQRATSIGAMPYFRPASKAALLDQVKAVVDDLTRRAASKPRTQKTLISTMNALFKKDLTEHQLTLLFEELCTQGIVRVDGTKVAYELPVAVKHRVQNNAA